MLTVHLCSALASTLVKTPLDVAATTYLMSALQPGKAYGVTLQATDPSEGHCHLEHRQSNRSYPYPGTCHFQRRWPGKRPADQRHVSCPGIVRQASDWATFYELSLFR